MSGQFIGAHERLAYTVEHRGNCVLIDGPVPVAALGALAALVPGCVLDADAAKVLGVTHVLGTPGDIEILRNSNFAALVG